MRTIRPGLLVCAKREVSNRNKIRIVYCFSSFFAKWFNFSRFPETDIIHALHANDRFNKSVTFFSRYEVIQCLNLKMKPS